MEKSERTCPKCHGTGWIIQVFGDREGAEPCDCSRSDWLAQKLKAARIPELYKACSIESLLARSRSKFTLSNAAHIVLAKTFGAAWQS